DLQGEGDLAEMARALGAPGGLASIADGSHHQSDQDGADAQGGDPLDHREAEEPPWSSKGPPLGRAGLSIEINVKVHEVDLRRDGTGFDHIDPHGPPRGSRGTLPGPFHSQIGVDRISSDFSGWQT